MTTTADILNRALALPANDRAHLAHEILLSLDSEEIVSDWDQAWQKEVELRSDKVERGESVPRDWRAVMDDIESQLRKDK